MCAFEWSGPVRERRVVKAFVLALRVALLAGVAAAIPVWARAADPGPVSADSTVTLVVDLSPDAALDKERLRRSDRP
jgi:hypothetical protein